MIDAEIRDLERAAASGDPVACERAARARERARGGEAFDFSSGFVVLLSTRDGDVDAFLFARRRDGSHAPVLAPATAPRLVVDLIRDGLDRACHHAARAFAGIFARAAADAGAARPSRFEAPEFARDLERAIRVAANGHINASMRWGAGSERETRRWRGARIVYGARREDWALLLPDVYDSQKRASGPRVGEPLPDGMRRG